MQWLEQTIEKAPEVNARRGPPRLPGAPNIPPMPVASSEAPQPPIATNKTIEVEASWLELVEERRAKNAQAKAAAASAAPKAAAPAPAASKKEPEATRPRPRIRPIIPREDD